MSRARTWSALPAIALAAAVTAFGCGFSPSEPSAIDSELALSLEPSTPIVGPTAIHYLFSFSLTNPSTGTPVRLHRLEFTAIGPDGSTYGTYVENHEQIFAPGVSRGGATGFTDTDVRRPLATRFNARVMYTREDGTDVTIAASSTFLSPF